MPMEPCRQSEKKKAVKALSPQAHSGPLVLKGNQLLGVIWACASSTDHTGGKIQLLLFLM